MFQFSDEYIQELLRQIYSGEITMYELPQSLYYSIADYLKHGLYEGFGGNLAKFEGTPDFALLSELRENIYMFSAAKTFQQVKELSSQLVDGDRVRTEAEFNKIGRQTFDKWNDDWGKSEYKTAIGQASMANKWADIERSKDVLPVLVFSTNGAPCEECAPYDGFAAPVDDPIWSWLYPLLHFNCMCIVLQEEEGYPVADSDKYDEIAGMKDNVPEAFQMNSGKDRVIFSDEHPYFDVAPKEREFAQSNFGLPIPPVSEELPKEPSFTPAKSIRDAENWALNYEIADKISYKGLEHVEVANEVNKALFELKNKTGITYNEIKTVNQSNGTVMMNESSLVKGVGETKFRLQKSTLSINNKYFNKFATADDIVKDITRMRNDDWTTAEDISGLVWHEIGHRLSSLNIRNGGLEAKHASPVFDYKRLGEYASTNIHETIAEILAYYKKTGEVDEKWEKIFNKWSEIPIKDL